MNKIILPNYLLKLSEKDSYKNKSVILLLKLYGVNSIIKECYIKLRIKNIKQKDMLSELKIPKSTFECWVSGRNPIPIIQAYKFLGLWKRLLHKSNKDFNKKWDDLFYKTDFCTVRSNYNKSILPKELNVDLAYLIGLILADGYIKDDLFLINTKRDVEHSICIYSGSKEHMLKCGDLFYKIFKVRTNIYFSRDTKGSWYTLRCCSKPVHRFFCDILGMKRGKKVGNVKIPKILKNNNNNLINNAVVAGFFDGDGGVGISTKNPWLEIAQKNNKNCMPETLVWIGKVLTSQKIYINKISRMNKEGMWRLRTAKKEEILNFYNNIPVLNPNKIEKFKMIKEFSYSV